MTDDAVARSALADAPRPVFGDDVVTTRAERPSDRIAANVRHGLFVLLGTGGLVLLVACSNVANLLLARGAARARDLALRSALGASTGQLVRALLAECLVLALVAGATGVAVGWLTLRVLVRLRPNSLSALDEVQLDPRVLAFTIGASIASALLFGVAPAGQLGRRKIGDALRHGASGVMRSRTGPRLRKLLVAAQMAISVVLLVTAGLLVRSVMYLQNVNPGFDPENLFAAQLVLPRSRYQEATSRDLVAEQLLERLRSLPGIAAATQAFMPPPSYMPTPVPLEIRDVTLSDPDARGGQGINYVQPDYFETVGTRMLEGRTFTADETRSGAAVIVNRAAAQRFWPDGAALGEEVKLGRNWTTVVGVVDNVVSVGATQIRDAPSFYWPFQTDRTPPAADSVPRLWLIVRAAEAPAIAIASLRSAARELDPEIAIPNVLLLQATLETASLGVPRFNAALLIAFALIAVVLATVGLAVNAD